MPGYKQTEVGIIPDDWKIEQVKQLADVGRGRVISHREIAKSISNLYPVYSSQTSNDGVMGFIDTYDFDGEYITWTTDGANAGTVFYRNGKFNCTNVCGTIKLRKDNALFVSKALGVVAPRHVSRNLGNPKLMNDVVKQIAVALPSSPVEQRSIATALSDVDALLAAQDKLIAKKRDIKQAAMQQLLTGKQRLPGFDSQDTKFIQTQVGIYPDDWDLVQLLTLVEPSRGIRYGIVQPGEYDSQGRYMIRGQDYSEVKGWANPDEVFRVSPEVEERYRNARVKSGDIIMTIVGYCGHVEMVPEWLDGANLTQTTVRIAIRPDKAVSAFCKYILLSPAGKNQVSSYMKGAAQPGLNCGDIKQFFIPLPCIAEQNAIATVLSDMDAEIAVLEQQRDKTRALKQGMMQELLTGRIRLV